MIPAPRIGVVALARPTFDVPFAVAVAAEAFETLEHLGADLIGPRRLLFDAPAVEAAIADLAEENLDLLLVLQVTFTDATMTVALAEAIQAPLLLWAFPEPRSGGRLRLNSLCGINLASHALGRAGKSCAYLYQAAGDSSAADAVQEVLSGAPSSAPSPAAVDAITDPTQAEAVVAKLGTARIGVLGHHPDGFDTCRYDPVDLGNLLGVVAEPIELNDVFAAAAAAPVARVADTRTRVAAQLGDLSELEQEPLDKSLRTYVAMKDLSARKGFDGLAVRCWPEFFTDYGCAACGAMALLNEERTPCACEADVYGNLTSLILQWLADRPALIADLVDVDLVGDTAVLWHCGLAPVSMADPEAEARPGIHSNRRKPLLNEFPLKPGRITVARLSQSRNLTRLVLAGAQMVSAPMSFSGTSGVLRFDRPAGQVLDLIMSEGLEHHYAMVYGEQRPALRAVAERLAIPVLELA
jgi:L-fucose isomerase-like protein